MTNTRLATLSLLLLAGCAGAPPDASLGGRSDEAAGSSAESRAGRGSPAALPTWVHDPGSHPSFPAARFLVGLGQARAGDDLSRAREQALESGRLQISSVLSSDLHGVTEVYMRDVGIDQEFRSTVDYEQRIENATRSRLFGSRIGAQHFDPASDALYALVVLDREAHARVVLQEVDAALARITPASRQVTAAGELRALLEEHAALDELMPALAHLELVVPRHLSLRAEVDRRFGSLKERIAQVLAAYRSADVSVQPVSGSGQRGRAREGLAEPLVFAATLGARPLAGFPVRFALEHPAHAEVIAAGAQTGPDGRFACQVTGLRLTGEAENEVLAGLDYESLGERVLRAPSASAFYVLPTLGTSTFAVVVAETNVGSAPPESTVGGRLRAALADREATLLDLELLLGPSDVARAEAAPPAWLRERLGGKVDFVIRGRARSEARPPEGGLRFAYAGGAFELIDVSTGEVLDALDVPLSNRGPKGSGSGPESAGQAALSKLADEVEARLVARVDALFGS